MKRTLLVLLVLSLCLSAFFGCSPRQEVEGTTLDLPTEGTTAAVTEPSAESRLRATLALYAWSDGRVYCAHESVPFTVDGVEMCFYPECGTIVDLTNDRSVMLSAEHRASVLPLIAPNFSEDTVDHSSHDSHTTPIKVLRYSEDGYGVTVRTFSAGDFSCAVIDALEAMPETGATVSQRSTQTVDENTLTLSIEQGTWWIEVGSTIYRMTPEMDKIYRVETHMGKGYVMTMADGFADLLNNAWSFYPYNYYATYNAKTGGRSFETSPYTVECPHVHIRDIVLDESDAHQDTLILDLISARDMTFELCARSWHSDDVYGYSDVQTVSLTANQPLTVELGMGGVSYSYDVTVSGGGILMRLSLWTIYD